MVSNQSDVSIQPSKPSVPNKSKSKKYIPFLLMLPSFIFYIIFWLYPVFQGGVEVFTDLDGNFTLLGNFQLMWESDLFQEAVINTGLFALISVILQYLLALLLAVLLNIKFKGNKYLMFIAMIPMAITPTAVAILWRTGLITDGWVNSILMTIGLIDSPIVFMNVTGFSALLTIILIDTWTVTPSVMIILSAGLQNVSDDLRESAYLFGANKWRIFRDVTLPILKPSIVTSIILRLIAAIQVWAIAVMVFGYGKVPFLVERVAFFEEVVPGIPTSEKIVYTLSFTTTFIVFVSTMIYYRLTQKDTRKERQDG